MLRQNALLLAFGIVALSFYLRFQFAFDPLIDGFSWREASTAMMTDNLPRNSWNPLWPEVSWTGDMPGYQGREFQFLTIFAALWNTAFGWADWSGRLVAAIFGALSTLILYFLVGILAGRRTGLVASFLYAIMAGPIVIDSSYLPDPAMLTLQLAALLLLLLGLESDLKSSRSTVPLLLGSAVIGTAAILAKLPALTALLPALYGLSIYIKRTNTMKRMLWSAIVLTGCVIPIVAYYRWAIYLGRTYPPFHVAGHGWLWEEGFRSFVEHGFYARELYEHLDRFLFGPIFMVLAAVGLTRTGWREKYGLFLPLWFVGCVLFYVSAALELRNNSWNMHVFSPVAAALAAAGITSFSGSCIQIFARVALVSALAFPYTATAVDNRKKPSRIDDYTLGTYLFLVSKPEEYVVVSGYDTGSPAAIYYSRRRGWIYPTPEMMPQYSRFSEDGQKAIEALQQLKSRGGRWFGITRSAHDQSTPSKNFFEHYKILVKYLDENAKKVVDQNNVVVYDLQGI